MKIFRDDATGVEVMTFGPRAQEVADTFARATGAHLVPTDRLSPPEPLDAATALRDLERARASIEDHVRACVRRLDSQAAAELLRTSGEWFRVIDRTSDLVLRRCQ